MATIEVIKNISILDYAESLGYSVVRKGQYYSLKEHDSVIIDPNKNCFWRHSTGGKGTVIDFVMDIEQKDLRTALHELGAILDGTTYERKSRDIKPEKVKATEFILPQKDTHHKNVFAYLTSTRKIDKDIVLEFLHNKNLYQDTYKNCVFVSYNKDGKADFANIRGTNTHKKFIADVEMSNYENCFYINNNSNKIIVTESVIDLMSIMTQTKLNKGNYKDYNYLSLSGVNKYSAILTHVKNPFITDVILALDNDTGGHNGARNIRETLKDRPLKIVDKFPKNKKDWNEELIFSLDKEYTEKKSQIKE